MNRWKHYWFYIPLIPLNIALDAAAIVPNAAGVEFHQDIVLHRIHQPFAATEHIGKIELNARTRLQRSDNLNWLRMALGWFEEKNCSRMRRFVQRVHHHNRHRQHVVVIAFYWQDVGTSSFG